MSLEAAIVSGKIVGGIGGSGSPLPFCHFRNPGYSISVSKRVLEIRGRAIKYSLCQGRTSGTVKDSKGQRSLPQ